MEIGKSNYNNYVLLNLLSVLYFENIEQAVLIKIYIMKSYTLA
jgi:hypothetical protein